MATQTKFTQWFSTRTHRPTRPGVYERLLSYSTDYAYWDGRRWYGGGTDPQMAQRNYDGRWKTVYKDFRFRGLTAEDPTQ